MCIRDSKSDDVAAVDTAMEELNAAWTAASQDLYAAQQEAGAGAEGGADAGAGDQASAGEGNAESDDVQDVEFEEVDDKA